MEAYVEPQSTIFENETYTEPVVIPVQEKTLLEKLEEELPPIMLKIGRCESGNKQFNDDGSVIKNPHSSAHGRFQIMASLHQSHAESMGMDIYTEEGNIQYALYLYSKNGTRDWNASRHCWHK